MPNSRLETSIAGIQGALMMRHGALNQLHTDDLSFSLSGATQTLGELLKSSGNLQHSYTQSFRTLKQDWSSQAVADELATIDDLKTWLSELDNDMNAMLSALTEDDLSKQIDRGNGVIRTVEQQLEIYVQALMIFFGKLVVYFQAMDRELPPSIQHYIV